jgi:Zn-dependent M16 (insulinase) family peptidase
VFAGLSCEGDAMLMQMVLETRASLEAGVIGAGHRFAASRLDAQRSTAGWVKEQMGGISYLTYIRKLAARIDTEWDAVKVRPSHLLRCLLNRQSIVSPPHACGWTLVCQGFNSNIQEERVYSCQLAV